MNLDEHFRAMQAMCASYLEPTIYVARNGMWAGKDDTRLQDKLFIADMIYMLDGPEQRAAQVGTHPKGGDPLGAPAPLSDAVAGGDAP